MTRPHLVIFNPDQWRGAILAVMKERMLVWYMSTADVVPYGADER